VALEAKKGVFKIYTSKSKKRKMFPRILKDSQDRRRPARFYRRGLKNNKVKIVHLLFTNCHLNNKNKNKNRNKIVIYSQESNTLTSFLSQKEKLTKETKRKKEPKRDNKKRKSI